MQLNSKFQTVLQELFPSQNFLQISFEGMAAEKG